MSLLNRRKLLQSSAAGAAVATLGGPTVFAQDDDKPTVTVGSHNYTEQFILVELCGLLLEEAGFPVEYEHNLGGSLVLYEGALSGDLDIYVDYLGGALAVLGENYNDVVEPGVPADEAQDLIYAHVKQAYKEEWDLRWLETFGLNNTYAIAMRREHAEELGVTKISHLEPHAADLRLGGSQEFIIRPIDGLPAMEEAYGFEFGESQGMESGLMYSALDNGDVDVISAFATDGRIGALDFVLLEDDLGFFPPYHAAPVVRGDLLEAAPDVEDILNQLGGLFDNTIMGELNYRVDGDAGEEPRDVARDFLTEQGLIGGDN